MVWLSGCASLSRHDFVSSVTATATTTACTLSTDNHLIHLSSSACSVLTWELLQIAVNGAHFTEFRHRMPMENVKYLFIDGNYMKINFIKYEGGNVSIACVSMCKLTLVRQRVGENVCVCVCVCARAHVFVCADSELKQTGQFESV